MSFVQKAYLNKWVWSLAGIVFGAGLTGSVGYHWRRAHVVAAADVMGAHCDDGIGAARREAGGVARALPAAASVPSGVPNGWVPKLNDSPPSGPAPAGMVWVPGGEFWMGSQEAGMTDAKPWHRVYVDGLWMDKTEVTNEQFARFVEATGYVTLAERKPRAEDYPHALPGKLFAGSVVFSPPDHPVQLDNQFRWWNYVAGANWRHPEGPQSDIKDRMNHPVVHIAYEDAAAYCIWARKRLPTEAEFEFASRGRLDRKRYVWGDEFMPGGKHMANTFQGHFPDINTGDDGYRGTAPVASFPSNGYGLFDMAGNVWEWTSDWYRADYYRTLATIGEIAINPKGPADGTTSDLA